MSVSLRCSPLESEERRHGEEEGDDPRDPGRGRRPGHGHHVAVDHGARDGEVPAAGEQALVCTVLDLPPETERN